MKVACGMSLKGKLRVNVKAHGDRGRIQRMGKLRRNGPIGFGTSGRRGDSATTHNPHRFTDEGGRNKRGSHKPSSLAE